MLECRTILAYFTVSKLFKPERAHFEKYSNLLMPDQKQKRRYNRTPQSEKKQKLDTPDVTTPSANGTPKKAPVKAPVRAGHVGGVRGVASTNKNGRRKEFKAPLDENGMAAGYDAKKQNCVLKVLLFGGINLDLIKELFGGRYEQPDFPSVTVENDDPLCAISYARSGEASVAGSKSRYKSALAAHLFAYQMTMRLKVPYEWSNGGPVNFACSLKFPLEAQGKCIDLHRFAADHRRFSVVVYDPRKFKGMRWFLGAVNMVVIMYTYGGINIVGAQSDKDVESVKQTIVPYLQMTIPHYLIPDPGRASSKKKSGVAVASNTALTVAMNSPVEDLLASAASAFHAASLSAGGTKRKAGVFEPPKSTAALIAEVD